MERIHEFNKEHSWIEISVLVDQRLTKLSDHGADIGIRIGGGVWEDSEYRLLMDEILFPVCSPSYAQNLSDPHSLTCMRDVKLLHDRDTQTSWEVWRKEFDLDWFDPAPGSRFASSDMVLDAAAKGMGVALARGRMAQTDLDDRRLVRLCMPHQISIPGAYWIMIRTESAQKLAVLSFVEWLYGLCANPAK